MHLGKNTGGADAWGSRTIEQTVFSSEAHLTKPCRSWNIRSEMQRPSQSRLGTVAADNSVIPVSLAVRNRLCFPLRRAVGKVFTTPREHMMLR